jgi:RNA polymerase sigma factor (sigma-70 family)
MKNEEDLILMRRIQGRDANALRTLYDRWERPMYAFAYRMVKDDMLAEEMIQELFLRVWNASERFQESQAKVSTWMFTLLRNLCIDAIRKRKSRMPEPMAPSDSLERVEDQSEGPEHKVERQWVGQEIRKALEDLNPDQKQVVESIYFGGLTQQEVAESLSIPLGTVKSRVRLAMKQLGTRLVDFGRKEREA